LAAETTYRAVEDDPVDDETICPGIIVAASSHHAYYIFPTAPIDYEQ
jgi:hypothetical protein